MRAMKRFDADIIIIGSGFGGSVCACRASLAGLRVVVLERGREISQETFEAMAAGRLPILHSRDQVGLVEAPRVGGLASIVGCGVGGGSHVYTAVTVPAPEAIFQDHWPPGLDAAALNECFQRVERMIAPTPIPIALPRTLRLESIAHRLGVPATRLPQAMDWPSNPAAMLDAPPEQDPRASAVSWLRGGTVTRKRSLDRTYLKAARAAGASILPLHEALAVIPEAEGYRVEYQILGDAGIRRGQLRAPRVILSAGTLGTCGLLLRCRAEYRCLPNVSPLIGRRFFTNGDMGALLICGRDRAPIDSGPPVTAWLDHWAADRMYLMDLGHVPLPPMLTRVLSLYGVGRLRRGDAAGNWAFGVMGHGPSPAELTMEHGGCLRVRRTAQAVTPYDRAVANRLAELAAAMDAKLIIPPAPFLARYAVTVHPLGGAAMADSPTVGVTDAFGEVFGHPGLYVADGSLLPTPIGRAPSMTIAALAERVISRILESC